MYHFIKTKIKAAYLVTDVVETCRRDAAFISLLISALIATAHDWWCQRLQQLVSSDWRSMCSSLCPSIETPPGKASHGDIFTLKWYSIITINSHTRGNFAQHISFHWRNNIISRSYF